MHSATKYLGGHSDVLGGALVVRDPRTVRPAVFRAKRHRRGDGAAGIVSLLARAEDARAARARTMPHGPGHGRVSGRPIRASQRVYYPGLAEHPGPRAGRAADGRRSSGRCSASKSAAILPRPSGWSNRRELFQLAVSLGAVESLIEQPASMSHASYDREQRLAHGITDGLIRALASAWKRLTICATIWRQRWVKYFGDCPLTPAWAVRNAALIQCRRYPVFVPADSGSFLTAVSLLRTPIGVPSQSPGLHAAGALPWDQRAKAIPTPIGVASAGATIEATPMGLRAFAPYPPRVVRRRRTTLGSGTKPRWGLDAAATDDCGTEYIKIADRKYHGIFGDFAPLTPAPLPQGERGVTWPFNAAKSKRRTTTGSRSAKSCRRLPAQSAIATAACRQFTWPVCPLTMKRNTLSP